MRPWCCSAASCVTACVLAKPRCTTGTLPTEEFFAHDDIPARLIPYLHPQHDIHPDDGWRILSDMILNGDVDVDTDTERVDIKLKAGMIPQKHLPENGELAVSPGLPDGFRVLSHGDNWSFRIVFPSEPAIGEDNYGDSVEVLSFLHCAGVDSLVGLVPSTPRPTTVNLTNVNVRDYRLEQTDDEYVEFRITQIAHGENVLRFSGDMG